MTEDTLADEYVKEFKLNEFTDVSVKPEQLGENDDELLKEVVVAGVESNVVENLKNETDARRDVDDEDEEEIEEDEEEEEEEEEEDDDDDDDHHQMVATTEPHLPTMNDVRSPLELPTTDVMPVLMPPHSLHQTTPPKGLPPPHPLLTPPDNLDHYPQQTIAFHNRHHVGPMVNSFKTMCSSNVPGTPPDTPPVSNSPSPRSNYLVDQQQQQTFQQSSQLQHQLLPAVLSSSSPPYNPSIQSPTPQPSYNNRYHPSHHHHHLHNHHHHHHAHPPAALPPHVLVQPRERMTTTALGLASDEIMLVSQSVDCIRTPRQEPLDLRPGNCVDGSQIEIQNWNVMQQHTSVITGHHGKRTSIFHPDYLNLQQQPPPQQPQTLSSQPEEHFHQLVPLHQQSDHQQQSPIFQQSNALPRLCQPQFSNIGGGGGGGGGVKIGGCRNRRANSNESRSYQDISGDELTGLSSFTSSNSYHVMTCTTSSSSSSINDGPTKLFDDDELLKCDKLLTNLSVRDLNARLKGKSRDFQLKVKQKRRTLKNRGYARNCREKRLNQKDELETTNVSLKSQLTSEETLRAEMTRERDYYKQRCEMYKEKYEKLLMLRRQQQCSVQQNLMSNGVGGGSSVITSKNATLIDYM